MNPFNLINHLLGRKPEVEKSYAAMLRGEPFTLEPGMEIIEVPLYPEAERIAASIRDFPDDWGWARKGYDLIHIPSGFRLWVANEDYGLAEVHPNNGTTRFSKPEQAIIWPAVEVWLARHKVGFTGRPVKPRITPSEGWFYCESPEHQWRGVGRTAGEAYRSWLAAVSMKARAQLPKGAALVVWSAAHE